jgi:hypothetical protein
VGYATTVMKQWARAMRLDKASTKERSLGLEQTSASALKGSYAPGYKKRVPSILTAPTSLEML